MEKHLFKITSLALLGILSVVIVLVLSSRTQSSELTVSKPPQALAQSEKETPDTEVTSPDGKWKAVLKEDEIESGKSYKLFIKNLEDETQKQVFFETLPKSASLVVPPNTFSSDNKFVFLVETDGSSKTYLVLRSSGDDLLQDMKVVEVSSLFYAKYTDFVITDVTGWAGPTLLIVNTDKAEGGIGPSFWFDLSNHSFTRLTTRFN